MSKDTLGVALRDVRGLLKDTMDKLDSSPEFREQLRLLLRNELASTRFLGKAALDDVRSAVRVHLVNERLDPPVCIVEADSFAYSELWNRFHVQFNWTGDSTMLFFEIGAVAGRPICVTLRFGRLNGHCVCFYDATSELVDHEMVRKFCDTIFPGIPHSDASNFFQAVRSTFGHAR